MLGAFVIEWLNETSNNEFSGGNARLLIFGGLLVLVVMFLPQGIIPDMTKPAAYLCRGLICLPPVETAEELRVLLTERRSH